MCACVHGWVHVPCLGALVRVYVGGCVPDCVGGCVHAWVRMCVCAGGRTVVSVADVAAIAPARARMYLCMLRAYVCVRARVCVNVFVPARARVCLCMLVLRACARMCVCATCRTKILRS